MNAPQAATSDGVSELESGDVWVVVPAYNEGPRLAPTLRDLCAAYPNVVVVDDGSRDDTAAVALQANVWLLRHVLNRGQGAALQTGIDFALQHGAGAVVTFDADGQHDVRDIAVLLQPLRAGQADVVLGSRFLGQTVGLPLSRRLVLKLGVLFTRCVSRVRVTDAHNGLRALSRRGRVHPYRPGPDGPRLGDHRRNPASRPALPGSPRDHPLHGGDAGQGAELVAGPEDRRPAPSWAR